MKTRFTPQLSTGLCRLFILILILGLEHYSRGDQIGFNIQLQQTQSPGNNGVSYGANPTLTSANGPITYYEVIAPNGAYISTLGPVSSGIGTSYADVGSFLAGLTNGLWTLILNGGDPSAQTNYFTVTINPGATTNFESLSVISPPNNAVGVNNQPNFMWIGPTNFADLNVDAHNNDYSGYTSADLPVGATNWTPGVVVNGGYNFFDVTYTNGNNGLVTISTPTNSLGQPLANWTGTASFEVQDTIDFFVGPLPELIAHYTFDNSNYLSQDSSGNGFDLQGPSWFGQPPGPSTDGFGGGALQFFGSGWYNLPPVILLPLASTFSVSVWLETTNMTGNDNDIGNGDAGVLWADDLNGPNYCDPLDLTGSKAAFYTGDTTDTLTSTTPVTTGQWVHVVVTRNITTGAKDIYINGVPDNSDSAGTALLNDSTSIYLGYNNEGSGYIGLMDDLQIYSVTLTPADVSYLFNNPESAITNSPGLGGAVDAAQLSWSTFGDSSWFSETTNTYDGTSAAQSGPVVNNQTSTLQTVVTGPGVLTFEWQTSPNGNSFDYEFSIDGVDTADLGPGTSWTFGSYSIGPGQHTLEWTAEANGDIDPTEAAYLGDVSYVTNSSAPPTSGHTLIAHYTFDDPSNVGADSSGNNLYYNSGGAQGTASVAPTNDAEAGAGALLFTRDPTDPGSAGFQGWYPTTPSQILSALAGSFTVSVWVKTTASIGTQGDYAYNGSAVIAADVPGVANDTVPIALTGGQVAFNTGDVSRNQDDNINSTKTVNDGVYHHVVVTRDQTTGGKAIYIDGSLDTTGTGTTSPLNAPKIVVIGAITDASDPTLASRAFSGGYDGEMDDLQIYSGVLNATEVSYLFSNPGSTAPNVTNSGPVTINSNGLVARYTFDSSANLGADASGNGYNLDYNGKPSGGGVSQSRTAEVGNGAAYFDGGSFLSYTATPSGILQTLAGTFTLSFWINTSQAFGSDGEPAYQGAGIVAADIPGQFNDIIPAALAGGAIGFGTGGSSDDTLNSSTDINDGNYHYIVVTRDQVSGQKQIYVDGNLDTQDYATTNYLGDPVLVAIGCAIDASKSNPASTSTANFYQGLLDDIQLYNRVLSAYEIGTLYNNPGQVAGIPPAFNAALGTTNIDWTTYGDVPWFIESTNTYNNSPMAVQSGSISGYAISVLQAAFSGPSTLTFAWQSTGNDYLELNIDGHYVTALYGNQPWTNAGPFVLGPGNHTLIWTSSALFGGASSSTVGFLDDVTFSNIYPPQIALQPSGTNIPSGSNLVLTAQILASPGATLAWLFDGVAIPGATNQTLIITNAQVTNSGNYVLTASNYLGFTNTQVASVAVYLPTDLQAVSLTAPSLAGSQTYITFVWTGSNSGTATVSNSYDDAVYLETNGNLAATYFHAILPPIAPGAAYTATNTILLPSAPAGNYTLNLKVDVFSNVLGDSGVNSALPGIPITIVNPDLAPTSLQATGTEAGQSLVINYSVINNGPSAVGEVEWLDNFYISTNAVLDTSAILVGQFGSYVGEFAAVTNLAAGQQVTNTGVTFQLPAEPAGNYYLILAVNKSKGLFESTYANNNISIPLTLTVADLVATNLAGPTVVSGLEPVSISWVDENIGNGPAESPYPVLINQWYDSLYLSTNQQVNSSSVQIGLYYPGSYEGFSFGVTNVLQPEQSVTNVQSVNIPEVPAGNYYLIVEANANSEVQEYNRSNNVEAVPITVLPLDMAVVSFTTPPAADSRDTITLSWNVTNDSTGTIYPVWTDKVYISPDPVLDSQAVLLGSFYWTNVLNVSSSYFATNSVTFPGLAAGNYYLLLSVNALGNAVETNLSNNFVSVPIDIGSPDLAAQTLVVPANLSSQQPLNVDYSVGNIGGVEAVPGWVDELFLSQDGILETNNILMGTTGPASPVLVGSSYTNLFVTVVPGVPAGDYFMLLDTDANDFFAEPNFANNVLTQSVHISNPDLTPTNFSSPSVVSLTQVNQQIDLNWSVVNIGAGTAYPSWNDDIYLSKTNVLDTNAVLVDNKDYESVLGPQQSYVNFKELTLPNGIMGNYFLIVDVNGDNGLYEPDHTNNTIVNPIQLVLPATPILSVISVGAPTDAWSGQSITVSWVLTNAGTGPVQGTFYDAVFLASDALGDNPQFYGSYAFTGEIPAGGSVTRNASISLPISLSGTYWVEVQTDVNQNIFQFTFRTNETLVASAPTIIHLTPTAQLEVASIHAPTNLFSGDPATVAFVVTNVGSGPTSASYWSDAVYISQQTNYNLPNFFEPPGYLSSAGATYLGSIQNASYLNPGQAYESSLNVTIPEGIEGTYYFIVRTDDQAQVFETNRNGSVLVSVPVQIDLTPPPDLQITSIIAPLNAFSGQPTSIEWSVTNFGLGQTIVSNWYDQVFLSTNSVLDPSAVSLGQFQHYGAINPDDGYKATNTVTLPIGISGNWYFIVKVDAGGSIYEGAFQNLNVTNPGYATAVALTPPPDLVTTILQAPSNALASHALLVTYSVFNEGATATPNIQSGWIDTMYISTNSVFDSTAMYMANFAHSGVLQPGEGYTNVISSVLPDAFTGTYYIFVMADSRDQVFELNKANNLAATVVPTVIVSEPADLTVLYLQAPSSGNTGGSVLVNWGITNQGPGDTAVSNWIDELVLSQNTVLGSPSDLVLLYVSHTGLLGAGQSYADTNEAAGIPNIVAPGEYYLFVVANAGNSVYEGTNQNNNVYGPVPFTVTSASADLEVATATAPVSAYAGSTIAVPYTIKNIGVLPPNSSYWYDAVYLTTNGFVGDPTTVPLGYAYNVSNLVPGASYTNTQNVELPPNIQGQYYIVVVADAGNYVSEPGSRANGTYVIMPPINILPGPVPDLVVTNIIVPAVAYEGQPFTATWTVQNIGPVAAQGYWLDAAYLSLDQTVDFSVDTYVGSVANVTNLPPGASYTNTASFKIPQGYAGPYYVSITADFGSSLGERESDSNTTFTAQAMEVELLPPVDLITGTIIIPTNAALGQNMTITYSVFNTGSNAAIGSWEDAIYISPTTNFSINDPLFATVQHTGTVPPNTGYTNTVTAPVPGILPGEYYVIVHSDILNSIPETDVSNTIASSGSTVDATITQLTLGTPVTGTLAVGQSAYYSFSATNGETILLQFNSADSLSGNELLVSEGAVPSLSQFEYAADDPFVASPHLYIPITDSGTYYVTVYGQYDSLPASYSLLAQVVPFSVAFVQPTYGGDTGPTTYFVQGALFDSTTFFVLMNATNAITNTTLFLQDSSSAYVTFDLAGQSDGLYNLLAITGGSNQVSAVLNGAVTVEPGSGPNDVYSIVGPPYVGEPDEVTTIHPMSIAYGNAGDSDSAPPLILVDGEGTVIGYTPYSLGSLEVEILGRNQSEPVTVLRPQDSDTVQMYFYGSSQENQARIILPTSTRPLEPTDWTNIQNSVRPPTAPDAAWNAFWGNIQPRIGPTWGDYVQFLDNIATQFPPDEVDVASMIGELYTNSPNFLASVTVSGTLLGDADNAPQAGVDIGFYLISSNAPLQLENSTTTDNNGNYTVPLLPPGQYTCAVFNTPNSDFDMNQVGQVDNSPPVFNLTNDLPNQTIRVYEPQPVVLPTNDANPTLTLDSEGILHNFWYRNDLLWHAWNSNGLWMGAAPISTNFATGYTVASAPNLVDGSSPGMIVVWGEEETNGMELFYSVSETSTNGAYQWSQPIMLTDDAVENASPAVAVRPDGLAIITYLKRGYGYQDDTDVYYSAVNVTSGSLLWNQPGGDVHLSGDIQPNVSFGNNGDSINVGPYNFARNLNAYGITFSIAAGLSGSIARTGCVATGSAKANVTAGVANDDIGLAGNGSIGISYEFDVDPDLCAWAFNPNATVGNVSCGMNVEIKNAAFQILKAWPPTVAFAGSAELAVDRLARWLNASIVNSLSIGGSVTANGCHWKTPPLFSFGIPSCKNSTGDLTAGITVAVKAAKQDWDINYNAPEVSITAPKAGPAGVTGTLGADFKFEMVPDFLPLSVTFNGGLSVNYKSWVLGAALSLPVYDFGNKQTEDPDSIAMPRDDFRSLPGWTVTYNPAAAVGTTNVYGTNAVLSTVATDLYMDGAPALAIDGKGVPYQVWYKDGDPYAATVGSQIYVADYNGSSWNAPVVIPGAPGFISYVNAATDNAGNRLAVWIQADSSGLPTNVTASALYAARNSADVTFSTFNGSSWSAPQTVAVTPGLDADLQLSTMANGNILAVWDYSDTNSLVHLVSSSWNGTSWTPLDEITSGTLNTPTAQQIGNETVVLWTAVLDTNNDTAIYESDNNGGVWSKSAPFVPSALTQSAGPNVLSMVTPQTVSPKAVLNLAVDPICCMCAGSYAQTKQPACPVATATYNYTNCTWTYTYKPCVVHPRDPNDLIGPAGTGPQQWVSASSPLNYTIEFANDPTLASAPAQQVNITMQLDPNLDPRTFRLGNFGFGGLYFTMPPNSAFYQTQIDLTATMGFYVDVFAGVNVSTRQAFWTITTIDPNTGNVPVNPLVGFLPPNTNAPNGEGFVEYSVSAASSDVTGTVVNAQASITFNGQPPLSTPSVFNTIETGEPVSAVQPLPAYTVTPTFPVSWQGVNAPGGVGITSYDIYFSENGGPYFPWLQGTTLNESAFSGQAGNSYAFYSIAHDSTGAVQLTPSVPDAVTFVSTNLPPVFAPSTNVVVTPDSYAAVPIQATDPNGDLLTYSLTGGPTNAVIVTVGTNVVLNWTPTRAYADTTNVFTITATDNGLPPLSATQTYTVAVLDYLQLAMGSTNVQGGQSGSVPVNLSSSSGVTNLTFTLQVPENILTNLSVQGIAPQISSATLQDRTTNVLITVSTPPAQVLTGTQAVVQLSFTATTQVPSAFVSLLASNISALKPSGAPYVNNIALSGSVAIVENQPLVSGTVSSNQTRDLVLFGKLGVTYQLQFATNLVAPAWQPVFTYVQTNGAITISLVPTNAVVFYRLQQQ